MHFFQIYVVPGIKLYTFNVQFFVNIVMCISFLGLLYAWTRWGSTEVLQVGCVNISFLFPGVTHFQEATNMVVSDCSALDATHVHVNIDLT